MKQLAIEILKLLIVGISVYIISPSDIYLQNLSKNILITIATLIIYFLLTYIKFICRPLHISIDMYNILTGTQETIYNSHSSRNEQQRTVQIIITIEKTNSMFSFIINKMLKDKECKIYVEIVPDSSFTLIPMKNIIIEKEQFGFNINLGSCMRQILNAKDIKVVQTLMFVVEENRDSALNGDGQADIICDLTICKDVPKFAIICLCKIKNNGHHIVHYYKKYSAW